MIGLMQCIAAELAEHQILANCVCPGQMQTDMIERLFKERSKITGKPASEVKKALLDKIPMGKLGSMSDLAGLIYIKQVIYQNTSRVNRLLWMVVGKSADFLSIRR